MFRLIQMSEPCLCIVMIVETFHRYYSATIIKMSGVKSPSIAIWLAAVTAAVNFIFTFVGVWLVERIGRRPLVLGSLFGEYNYSRSYLVILPIKY